MGSNTDVGSNSYVESNTDLSSNSDAVPPRPRPDKATLDRVFGIDLTGTRDDLPDPEIPTPADSWYHENRPPHHNG